MKITLTIPNEKLEEFRTGFLAMCPVPMIEDPENPGQQIPEFTELQWFKEWIIQDLKRAYRHGKKKLAKEAVQIDEDILK